MTALSYEIDTSLRQRRQDQLNALAVHSALMTTECAICLNTHNIGVVTPQSVYFL
jgi:hypothetical protein